MQLRNQRQVLRWEVRPAGRHVPKTEPVIETTGRERA